jgi:hypothetical protein
VRSGWAEFEVNPAEEARRRAATLLREEELALTTGSSVG